MASAANGQQHPDTNFREGWVSLLSRCQTAICSGVEELEEKIGGAACTAKKFSSNKWDWEPGEGGGLARVLQDGAVFAKAGVNVSSLRGRMPLKAVQSMCARNHECLQKFLPDLSVPAEDAGFTFFASGISLVIHPANPMAPTVHANFRLFQLFKREESIVWWFGGGIDLSPCYVIEEDCVAFHSALKEICDKFDVSYYPKFKVWCDYYFRIPHRREARGVGGIFFDGLNGEMRELSKIRDFCEEAMFSLAAHLYLPIVAKRCRETVTEKRLYWQQIRRGRYAEFNLVYDRGTRFGLSLPGSKAENILMSLPPLARWEYEAQPEKDSEEAASLEVFVTSKHWVPFDDKLLEGFTVPLEEGRPPEVYRQ